MRKHRNLAWTKVTGIILLAYSQTPGCGGSDCQGPDCGDGTGSGRDAGTDGGNTDSGVDAAAGSGGSDDGELDPPGGSGGSNQDTGPDAGPEAEECPSLPCDDEGETGATLRTDNGNCICETDDGYFTALEGNTTTLCDSDGDGWVNSNAQAAMDGDDEVLYDNANCDVRRITTIELVDEAGDGHNVDLLQAFPQGLPLYETARNDGADASNPHDPYGPRQVPPAVLSSFTKACVNRNGDYNDNGAHDVSEWVTSELGSDVTRNDALEKYFRAYTRFSYYFELYDGTFDGAQKYRIVERSRTDDSGWGVPLVYPNGSSSHWRVCGRHPDVDYADSPESRAGGDLTEFLEGWAGILHHSQFKCVEVVSEADYGDRNRAENPEIVYKHSSSLGVARGSSEGGTLDGCPDNRVAANEELHTWTANSCEFYSSAKEEEATPAVPRFSCQTTSFAALNVGVTWMAVGFEASLCDDGLGEYQRGCLNECAETTQAPPECYLCAEGEFGEETHVPAQAGTSCSNDRECDGAGSCGDCVPGVTDCVSSTQIRTCTNERVWGTTTTCPNACVSDECAGDCVPETRDCNSNTPRECSLLGVWESETACTSVETCVGAGDCQKNDGESCSNSDDCVNDCNTFYLDNDGDDYGTTPAKFCGASPPLGYAAVDGDCCDLDGNAKPGVTAWFTSANGCGNFNYNCVNGEEKRFGACGCDGSGYWDSGPNCGNSAPFYDCSYNWEGICNFFGGGNRAQECR